MSSGDNVTICLVVLLEPDSTGGFAGPQQPTTDAKSIAANVFRALTKGQRTISRKFYLPGRVNSAKPSRQG